MDRRSSEPVSELLRSVKGQSLPARRALPPNEACAIAVARAGCLPVVLSGTDCTELPTAAWRTVNDHGISEDWDRTSMSRAARTGGLAECGRHLGIHSESPARVLDGQ